MRTENTIPVKTFILELMIYGLFMAAYFYLTLYASGDWLLTLYHQGQQLSVFEFAQHINWPIALVLGLLILAIVLFALESLSVDIITLLCLMALIVTGVLTPAEAFAGFSNDILIILASIFVISGALQQTGIMDAMGVYLLKVAGKSTNRLMLLLMAIVGGISMFINNTTATAVFIPSTMGIAKRIEVSSSKLLMPLAFASILGGTCTLIGTSTNVAVSGYIVRLGLQPLGLFELLPIGLIILGVGILYMLGVSRYLLPDNKDESLSEDDAIREYLSEVVVKPESGLVGQCIFESDLSKLDFRIVAVLRGQRKFRPNIRSKIQADDILLVQGQVDDLMTIKETAGIEIKPELKWEGSKWLENGESETFKLAELLIVPQSDLINRTLKSANFLQKYGATVLAIYRHGQTLGDKIGRIRLRLGDLLLVQGPAEQVEFLRRSPDFWILEELSPALYRKRKGIYSIILLIAAIMVGGFGWLPLSVAFLGAVVLVILFHCITIEEAYEFMPWQLIILIAGMTAFGTAMEKTGAAELLASWIIYALQPYGVIIILGGFLALTVLLTQPMSNAAAALVVLPVALNAAQHLGVNERTFAIAIMLAASISLITPLEPSCLLVYGPGKYKFRDFIRTGGGLTIILLLIVLLLAPVFWPL